MPDPNQICPTLRRERQPLETDASYAERMKRLDERDELLSRFIAAKKEPTP
jgi:hypothetical protein